MSIQPIVMLTCTLLDCHRQKHAAATGTIQANLGIQVNSTRRIALRGRSTSLLAPLFLLSAWCACHHFRVASQRTGSFGTHLLAFPGATKPPPDILYVPGLAQSIAVWSLVRDPWYNAEASSFSHHEVHRPRANWVAGHGAYGRVLCGFAVTLPGPPRIKS